VRPAILTLLILAFSIASAPAAVYLRDEAGVAGLQFGAAVSGLEDQNGDGAWEVLVGAPGYQAAGQDAGRAYLWFGGTALDLNANRVFAGHAGEHFGHSVSRIGDVNGDGTPDIAIGAPYADNAGSEAGRVYLFYGGDPLPTAPDVTLEGPAANGQFGWAIAALGDLDGDGRDDFAVGAPRTNTYGIEAGAAYVYFGRSGGPLTTPSLTLAGSRAYEHFGWSVAGVADFLGGSANCVAVGAPSHDTAGTAIAGRVYVFEGSTSPSPGPDATVDLTLESSSPSFANNEFGYSIAGIGSYDGDSDPDLAVGIPYFSGSALNAGRVEVFFGGLDADADSDRYANGPAGNSNFGWSVAGVGDVTASGAPDVLVGAPFDDQTAANAGRAFLLAGGTGNVDDADSLPEVDRGSGLAAGTEANDGFGGWCATIGDIDGDLLADYAVGATAGNVTSVAVAGWVRCVDSSSTVVPVLVGAWSCSWTDDGGAAGAIELFAPESALARVRFCRRDAAGRLAVLHDGPPRANSAAFVESGLLRLRDADAAYQAAGGPSYLLELELTGFPRLAPLALAGPGSEPPAAPARLGQAHPNPFNPRTTITYRAAAGTAVTVRVFDLRGRRIQDLVDGVATGAWQSVAWDGRDGRGTELAAGVYLVRLVADQAVRTSRIVLAK